MHVVTSDAELASHLHRIAGLIAGHGGYVVDDFTVREQAGEFSCAVNPVDGKAVEPGRILLSYPPALTVPMWPLTWSADPDAMEPVAGMAALAPVQRALLEQWLPLVNRTAKLAHIRATVPQHSARSWGVRHHLADAGYPRMRRAPEELDPKDTLIGWHSLGGSETTGEHGPTGGRWRLIPLKHLVNHSPQGAAQDPVPGRIAVAASELSPDGETFENYGDLDALGLAMTFGFTVATPLLHSVPISVESAPFGLVQVVRRARRRLPTHQGHPPNRAQLPTLHVVEGGLTLSHLTMRPGNRGQLVAHISQTVREGGVKLPAGELSRAAEDLLDAIARANREYYRRLDALVAAAETSSASMLLAMASLLQQQAWATM